MVHLLVIESGSWLLSSETVHFKGDTLGINFSLEKIIFPFDLLFLALSFLLVIRDMRLNRPSSFLLEKIKS